METFPKFIAVWKDLDTDKIVRSRIENNSEKFVKSVFGNVYYRAKLLYLFRVKKVKHGKMSIPQLLS